eukprot:14900302-Alexandrium_andersonii.AAC.1
MLQVARDAIAIHRSGKALLLSDSGSSARMLWVAQVLNCPTSAMAVEQELNRAAPHDFFMTCWLNTVWL